MRSGNVILLLDTGTPDAPDRRSVRKFLSRFLNDKKVIDLPWLFRKILVNLIIVPFRASRSSKLYKRLWTERGSPLQYYGLSLQDKLQERLGEKYIVKYSTNYGNPGIKETITGLLRLNPEKIIAFPLFPQYASSTTGSVLEKCHLSLVHKNNIPRFITVNHFYGHPEYINALASTFSGYDINNFDHLVMSFHGLPLRQVKRAHRGLACSDFDCTGRISEKNFNCYRAMCYETSRLLAAKLSVTPDFYTVSFQSRISKKWLTPFTDEVIISLAKHDKKNIMVVCPSFTADCLETLIEVGEDYRSLFIRMGGERLELIPSLNDRDIWVDAISKIINC